METIAAVAPALGCVLMMAPLMWLMTRAARPSDSGGAAPSASELATLREEVARLREAQPRAGVGE